MQYRTSVESSVEMFCENVGRAASYITELPKGWSGFIFMSGGKKLGLTWPPVEAAVPFAEAGKICPQGLLLDLNLKTC